MPTVESPADLDIQVRAHILAHPGLYEQAGRDLDTIYSPKALWQEDLAFFKAQACYPVKDYPTLELWRSQAKRMSERVVPRMLEHYRADRGIPPSEEAATVILVHWLLTDRACNMAPVKLTEFQDWSIGSVKHKLARVFAHDIASSAEWREYVCKALAVMHSQVAIAERVPVPILGVIWHDLNAPTPALTEAFNRYWQTLDAATVPAGDDRRIPEDSGAVLLSEATEGLHNALAIEDVRLAKEHGVPLNANPVQFEHSDDPNGPWEPVPADAIKATFVPVTGDSRLMTAIERSLIATACPLERHNAQNAIKPGGPHQRYFAGDVIQRGTLDALESVGKLLRLNDHPPPAASGSQRVEHMIALVGARDSDAAAAEQSTMPALTADHEAVLAVLARTPAKCMPVIDVASGGPIRNRETVGRLLKELKGFGLVNRPHGKRKGYALTEAGKTRANPKAMT